MPQRKPGRVANVVKVDSLRGQKRLTLEALAHAANISTKTLSTLRAGKRVTLDTILGVARALGVEDHTQIMDLTESAGVPKGISMEGMSNVVIIKSSDYAGPDGPGRFRCRIVVLLSLRS
jgi:transcriptional regulator with XRE-family HTH domain